MVQDNISWEEVSKVPDAGDFNDEDLYNPETDKWKLHSLRVNCPMCGRTGAPLMSPHTICVDRGWRWVGLDHKEPYGVYLACCPKCKNKYKFTTHTPQ